MAHTRVLPEPDGVRGPLAWRLYAHQRHRQYVAARLSADHGSHQGRDQERRRMDFVARARRHHHESPRGQGGRRHRRQGREMGRMSGGAGCPRLSGRGSADLKHDQIPCRRVRGHGRHFEVRRPTNHSVRRSARTHQRGQDRQEAASSALHAGRIDRDNVSFDECATSRSRKRTTMSELTMSNLKDRLGSELGVSDWMLVDQELINEFAKCTGDRQWIHVDVERARRESPFGGPVAHGYLTLSLIGPLSLDVGVVPSDAAAGFNYGLDKVRFLAPVPAGGRVRLRVVLDNVEERNDGQLLVMTRNTIEIENSDKPALIAEALALLVPAKTAG